MTAAVAIPAVVRGLHWGIALIVALNALVLPAGRLPHRMLGLLAAALVCARLALMVRVRVDHINPKAIFVYGAIWLTVSALGLSGWMTQLDAFWGNSTLKLVHAVIAYSLGGLVLIHLAGVLTDAVRHKRPTWMRMIAGR